MKKLEKDNRAQSADEIEVKQINTADSDLPVTLSPFRSLNEIEQISYIQSTDR